MNVLDSSTLTNQVYMTSSTLGCNNEVRFELLNDSDDQSILIYRKIKPQCHRHEYPFASPSHLQNDICRNFAVMNLEHPPAPSPLRGHL
jgi:hypothetical protein